MWTQRIAVQRGGLGVTERVHRAASTAASVDSATAESCWRGEAGAYPAEPESPS